MTIDEGVEATQSIGLFEAAIGSDRRVEALVAEEKTYGLVFARMRGQKQLGREVAERVGVENNSRLSCDPAFDLGAEVCGGLGAAGSRRREQVAVGILREDRPASGEVEIQKLAKRAWNFERQRRPVLHLFRRNDNVAHASRPGPTQVAADMEGREVLHPHRRDQENPNRQRQLDPDRSGMTYRPCSTALNARLSRAG